MQLALSSQCFASQFKKYRLLSGFFTLSDFSVALANEGIQMEPSIFSHWQRGARIPSDRRTVIFILKVFVKNKGIRTIGECNLFLETIGFGNLARNEIKEIFLDNSYEHQQEKIINLATLNTGFQHYTNFFNQVGKRNFDSYTLVEDELSTLIYLLDQGFEHKFFKQNLLLWEYIAPFLWDTGRWTDLEAFGQKMAGLYELSKMHKPYVHLLTNYLSRISYWRGDTERSKTILSHALEVASKCSDEEMVIQSKLRLGLIFQDEKDYSQAENYFNDALHFYESKNDLFNVTKSNLYLSGFYTRKDNPSKAEKYAFTALKLSKDPENYSRALHHSGCILHAKGERDKSIEYLSESLDIAQKGNYKMGIGFAKRCLAIVDNNQALAKESDEIFSSVGAKYTKITTLIGI